MAYNYKTKIQQEQLAFSDFLKKRLLKIYPLYCLTNIFCIVAIGICIRHELPTSLKALLFNTFLINWGWVENVAPVNGPGWFLSVVLLCYIVFFFLCWLSRGNRNMFMYMALVMTFWGHILLLKGFDFPFSYSYDGEGFFNFFWGSFMCEIYIRLSDYGKKCLSLTLGVILSVIGVLSYCYGISNVIDDFRTLFTVLILPAILFVSIGINWFRRILEIRIFTFIGKISMSIMLWHRPLEDLTYVLFRKSLFLSMMAEIKFAMYILVVFLVSIASYLLFENGNLIYKWMNFLWKTGKKNIKNQSIDDKISRNIKSDV